VRSGRNHVIYNKIRIRSPQVIGIGGDRCGRSLSGGETKPPRDPPEIQLYRRADLIPEHIATRVVEILLEKLVYSKLREFV
jgi:hypothetical protein